MYAHPSSIPGWSEYLWIPGYSDNAMPKDVQGSFSSKCCHDNYLYYVHPKNGMVSLDMSVLRSTVQFESIVSFYRFSSSEW